MEIATDARITSDQGVTPTDLVVYDSIDLRRYFFNELSDDQLSRWKIGHTIWFRISSSGAVIAERTILGIIKDDNTKGPGIIVNKLTTQDLQFGSPTIAINKTLIDSGTAGIFISKPGVDITNPAHAQTGNLIFDSTDYIQNSLFYIN